MEKKTKKKEETKPEVNTAWLQAFDGVEEEGYEEERVRDNIIKKVKDISALQIFLYGDIGEGEDAEDVEDVEPISMKEIDVSLLSYKKNKTRFADNTLACNAVSNIDGTWLMSQEELFGTNVDGESTRCLQCPYNRFSNVPDNLKEEDSALQCKDGYFIYVYSPELGKVLRLTISPSGNKQFKEVLNALSRRRKADKKEDGNPHFNAEYKITIGTEKMKNKSNSWRIFTFTLKDDKWGADEANDIIESMGTAKERISSKAISASKQAPAIASKSVAKAINEEGEELEVEIVNVGETLDEDDLPFDE